MKKLVLSCLFLISCNLSDSPLTPSKPDASSQKDETRDKNQDVKKDVSSKDLGNDPSIPLCQDGLSCPKERPICDDAGKCVPCTSNDMCGFETPLCVDGECVSECNDDRPCSDGQFCDSSLSCVMCLINADCPDSLPRCEAGTCVAECDSDTDCTDQNPFCINTTCVECAAAINCPLSAPRCTNNKCQGCQSDADCSSGVCSASGSCEADPKQQCGECLGDKDCKLGYHCIKTSYGGQSSRQCLEIKTPSGKCPDLYRVVVNRKSVDGAAAVDHCGFNETLVTCKGAGDFYTQCTKVSDCENSASCLTIVVLTNQKQCTHQCLSDLECPAGVNCRVNYCRNSGPK